MKKNRTFITIFLVIMTLLLLGTTVYISTLLSSASSPTQIKKTKAADVSYSRKVDLFPTGITDGSSTSIIPTVTTSPTIIPTVSKTVASLPTKAPTLLAQAPTLTPTSIPTKVPLAPLPTPTIIPTVIPGTIVPLATPTLQPLLAYKSTTISPTVVPTTNMGVTASPTKTPSPTKKIQPTGVQQLPETGWIQISSILFIVAASTILFSLLF